MQFECARHRERDFAVLGVRVALGRDRGGRDRRFAVRLQVDMRLPADMPQLLEDAAALGVHRVGDAPPSCDLSVGVDARRTGITVAAGRDRRGFGDDQTAFGRALRVVFDHQVARDVAGIRAHPRQRRHHDAMGQLVGADLGRREQLGHRSVPFVCLSGRTAADGRKLRPTGRLMRRHALTAAARWRTGIMSSGSGRRV